MKVFSLCLTNFNRYELLLDSFFDIMNDDRIGEIIISDDASNEDIFQDIRKAVKWHPKVKLFRNETNQDCYRNKMIAISKASNDFVAIIDSDNKIDKRYIDAIYREQWDEETILAPEWAMPTFDYREFSGLTISRENVSLYMDRPFFSTCLNCMNYFVNKNKYLEVWDGSQDPVTADSIFQAYNWLKAGYNIKIVEGMRYTHLIHSGSHYQNNVKRTPNGFYEKIENNLKCMSNGAILA
jgi:glycosyltransferase involved in cell wall biosynthesis